MAGDLAVLSLYVVPDVRNWSAPRVMTALTGVVQGRQCAADPEHNKRQNDQYADFHAASPRRPPSIPTLEIVVFQMNRG